MTAKVSSVHAPTTLRAYKLTARSGTTRLLHMRLLLHRLDHIRHASLANHKRSSQVRLNISLPFLQGIFIFERLPILPLRRCNRCIVDKDINGAAEEVSCRFDSRADCGGVAEVADGVGDLLLFVVGFEMGFGGVFEFVLWIDH